MDFDKKKVIQRLEDKQANRPCHRCGNQKFTIIDGYSKMFIQQNTDNMGGLSIGGPVAPVILVACTRCGAITLHAAGVLDLLPQDENNASPKY